MRRSIAFLKVVGAVVLTTDQRATIGDVVRRAGFGSDFEVLEAMSEGFSNKVYKIQASGTMLVAKIFSESLKARSPVASQRGRWDEEAGLAAIGPRVYGRSADALLTEFVNGATLTAHDLTENKWALAMERVAPKLAALHRIGAWEPGTVPVVWQGMWALLDLSENGPMGDLRTEVARALRLVEHELGPPDVCAHGDLKASNMVLAEGNIIFIDFELAGPGYAAYDVAKLFRNEHDRAAIKSFVEAYTRANHSQDIESLLAAVDLLLPLAWLEAVVFFAYMASTHPANPDWLRLAKSRWTNYERIRDHRFCRSTT